jgi:hypothetical protein
VAPAAWVYWFPNYRPTLAGLSKLFLPSGTQLSNDAVHFVYRILRGLTPPFVPPSFNPAHHEYHDRHAGNRRAP